MAAWQFDMIASFEDGGTVLPAALFSRAQALLRERFGIPPRVGHEWIRFGDENSNEVELLWADDGTCELWVRIDARTDDDSFLRYIVILMIEMECQLFAPELEMTFPAQMDLLKEALQASSAWRYAVSAS
jgi:hypothetical protein